MHTGGVIVDSCENQKMSICGEKATILCHMTLPPFPV